MPIRHAADCGDGHGTWNRDGDRTAHPTGTKGMARGGRGRAAADGVGDSVGASDGALRSRAVDTDVDGNAREMKCWH